MTSPYARPDRHAITELERLIETLEAELVYWRERGQRAEQDAVPVKGKGHQSHELHQARQRIAALETENRALQQRIVAARERIEQLRSRMRFVEDHEAEGVA